MGKQLLRVAVFAVGDEGRSVVLSIGPRLLGEMHVAVLCDILSFVISTSLRHQPAVHPSARVGIHPFLVKERVWRADLGEKRSGTATCGQKQGEPGRKLPRAGSSSLFWW